MFGWINLRESWRTEQAFRVLEVLKSVHIRCRMPADDMFFMNPFQMPHPALRWDIQVRRRDLERAMALLVREGLAHETPGAARAAEEPPADAAQTARPGLCTSYSV